MNTMNNNLWLLLKKSGKTQIEFAKAVNVSRETVGTWLSGKKTPHPANLAAIAAFFGVPVEHFTEAASGTAGKGTPHVRTPAASIPEAETLRELERERIRAVLLSTYPDILASYKRRLDAGEPPALIRKKAAQIDSMLRLDCTLYQDAAEEAIGHAERDDPVSPILQRDEDRPTLAETKRERTRNAAGSLAKARPESDEDTLTRIMKRNREEFELHKQDESATAIERAAAATQDPAAFLALFPSLKAALAEGKSPTEAAATCGIPHPSRVLLAHLRAAAHAHRP